MAQSTTAGENSGSSKKSKVNPFIEQPRTKSKQAPSDAKNAKLYFSQYCGSTSIHGIQYLGERGRYPIEKIIWLMVILTVGTLCILLILKSYNKWKTTPVIVTFATTERSISTIPFPAITICPEVKTDPRVFNFTSLYIKKMFGQDIDPFENLLYESVSLICDFDRSPFGDSDESYELIKDEYIMGLALAVPELDPLNISTISWLGQKETATSALSGVFTSEGLCYTFNMVDVDDLLKDPEEYFLNASSKARKVKQWSLDVGYPNLDINESYPRRTFLTGPEGGFLFDAMTTNRSHLDYFCKESLQGYKVVLHHPAEWPNLDRHFRVPLNSAVYVGIKPRLTTVSEDLKDYSPEDRKCYFTDDRELIYFKSYTQNNCLMECYANYTLRKCNCIAFYMPKDRDSPVCGYKKQDCVWQSKVDYLKYDKEKCSCLPSCTSLEYDLEISQTDWDWHRIFNVLRVVGGRDLVAQYEKVHLSRLGIYFKELQFLNSERHELHGVVDFLSDVGGLLGLFIGISVTSFIEIIYFCSLRFYCNYKKYGRRYWSGEPELLDATDDDNAVQL